MKMNQQNGGLKIYMNGRFTFFKMQFWA